MKKLILIMLAGSMMGCASVRTMPQRTSHVEPTTADSLYKSDSLEWVQDLRLARQENRLWLLLIIIVLLSNSNFVGR